jgi:aminoglycoside phosphotransferase family enzyme
LELRSERQRCQLEALKWNKVFTQNVYIGLARIYTSDLDNLQSGGIIELGEVIEESNLVQETLDRDADYALLMRRLPDNRRLDILLEEEDENIRLDYAKLVIDRVIEVHEGLPLSTYPDRDENQWGSIKKLEEKLNHNLRLFDSNFPLSENDADKSYAWQREKDFLQQILTKGRLPEYFQQRVQEQSIKRCHGDLKAPNIWIVSGEQLADGGTTTHVLILDAIDFNPMYYNIDVLSDMALLVADIHARTKSRSLADKMLEYYLQRTSQGNEVCNAVLAYYLVEKAIFSAAIIYLDEKPDLDLASSFWEIAKLRIEDVKRQVNSL